MVLAKERVAIGARLL